MPLAGPGWKLLRRHLTSRVRVGSNIAQGFYAHAQEEHGTERQR
jgi:hypothetical protein